MAKPIQETKTTPKSKRFRFVRFLRNRLITGIIVALPILAIIWGVTTFVNFIDTRVWTLLPAVLNPKNYIGFQVWGLGAIIAVVLLIILGMFVSNYVGNRLLNFGERLLGRVPIVSSVYASLKQIVNTVAQQKDRAFRDVCLIEYPRKGLWAVGFVTADLKGAPKDELGEGYLCVFVPTTPNPTSGFLLFVKTEDVRLLDMTPEEGAKMIISGGMVAGNEELVLERDGELVSKVPTKDGIIISD